VNRALLAISFVFATMGALVALGSTPTPPPAGVVRAQEKPAPKPAPTEDRVGFPEGYETAYRVLFVLDRPDIKQVRVIYGNEQAAAARPGGPQGEIFPYGSVLVMETYRAKQDAAGNVELDANGRYQRDQLTGIFVMRKEPGFGEAYQVQRSGEWEYVAFRPDRTYQSPPQNTNACAACHQDAGATRDWVFRANAAYYGETGALPQAPPGLAALGRIPIQDYLFLPETATVKRGTTVTWTNEDAPAHTVTAADGSFDSGRLAWGDVWRRTFDQAGTFEYTCAIHPAMKARLIVED
jgi:plastocyanin